MHSFPQAFGIIVIAASAAAGADNLLKLDRGTLLTPWPFEVWGVEIESWSGAPVEPVAFREMLEPWACQGINSLGIDLDAPRPGGRFFAQDGAVADAELGRRFTRLTTAIRNLHTGTVVSLFSARRECWLSSPAAYRKAAEQATRLLPPYHSAIFVVGDLFGESTWAAEAPCPLDRPEHILDVCQAIHAVRSDVLLAVPASALGKSGPTSAHKPLLYAARDIEAMATLLKSGPVTETAPASRRWAAVPADQFFCRRDAKGAYAEAVAAFVKQVETRRRSVRQPAVRIAGKPPERPALAPDEQADGWVALFDGASLDHWTTLEPHWASWSIVDGALQRSGRAGTWLRSKKRYGSFILRLEYRIVPDGNSGVFVWGTLDARSSAFGMEVQLRGVQKTKMDEDTTGAVYSALPPREDAGRPAGEWNEVEITCRGSKVQVTVNGRRVQDFDADQVPALRGRLRAGFIGLQDHESDVWFRRVRIKELD